MTPENFKFLPEDTKLEWIRNATEEEKQKLHTDISNRMRNPFEEDIRFHNLNRIWEMWYPIIIYIGTILFILLIGEISKL